MNEKPKITDNNAEVIKMNVYIKVEESVCIDHKEIKMKDIMSLYCTDKDMEQQIKNKSIYHFIDRGNQRKCFSVLKVIEKIKEVDKTLDVINLGPQDFIVYYKKKQDESKIMHYGKIFFVMLVAFFGASFSIMTYNTDVGIEELFYNVYEMIMGSAPNGPNLLHVSYTIGLAIGIIIFFNHAGKIKLNDDPTPFEVQMRLYERDVNDTLMIDAGRKEEEEDVDS